MMTPGHHQIPSEDCYQQFAKVVGQFLEANKNNGKTIKQILKFDCIHFLFIQTN
jgi:hypothetical protein